MSSARDSTKSKGPIARLNEAMMKRMPADFQRIHARRDSAKAVRDSAKTARKKKGDK